MIAGLQSLFQGPSGAEQYSEYSGESYGELHRTCHTLSLDHKLSLFLIEPQLKSHREKNNNAKTKKTNDQERGQEMSSLTESFVYPLEGRLLACCGLDREVGDVYACVDGWMSVCIHRFQHFSL